MYDYFTYRRTEEAIREAKDSVSFNKIINQFLQDAAMNWWHGLEENQRQAIILLDFNRAVVTTMVFFSEHDWGFCGSYTDVLTLILEKAEELARSEHEQAGWHYDMDSLTQYVKLQFEAEQAARSKAAAIASELCMETGISTLENLLVSNSGIVRCRRKSKLEHVKEMRKELLHDVLNYLEKHYMDNEEEDE